MVKPTRGKMIAGVLLVFLAGAALGGLGARMHLERRIQALVHEGPPARLVPRFIGRLVHELDLPPERRAEVEAIAQELKTDLIALRGKYRPELEQILDDHLARIRERLTPAEQARMDQFRERRWRRRGHRRGPPGEHGPGGPGRGRGRRLLERLGLTPEQAATVRPVLRDFFEERRALVRRLRSAPDQDRPDVRRKLRILIQETEARLAEVLTPEQMANWRAAGPGNGPRPLFDPRPEAEAPPEEFP